MTDNCIYEIEHYGMILNANRTYYLTRSQPPFLTQMILEIFCRTHDLRWLQSTLPAIRRYYDFWTNGAYLTPPTGLSRYYGGGVRRPAPEVVHSEVDEKGRNHYDRVREYCCAHQVTEEDLAPFYDTEKGELTSDFYAHDHAMRESGCDPSNRFGPFNTGIIHFNPVCLNSLLYRMEMDTAGILALLSGPCEAKRWLARAERRAREINELMWDEQDGLYYDYNFVENRVRRYPFITTFYPLWAGIADHRQAARVVRNLHLFARAGGLQTSTNVSGNQWDAPIGWAPMQIIAVEGLRRYGFNEEADRISIKFLKMVLRDFHAAPAEQRTLKEKYDVVAGTSDVDVKFGYPSNEVGFGWTNAAFIVLYEELWHVGSSSLV